MIFIALGANLPSRFGDPPATIMAAVSALRVAGVRVQRLSRLFLTAPVPISDQPWFCNAVVDIETELSPQDLLTLLHSIEHDFGRVRQNQNEARILDLDIIAYDDEIIQSDAITIPHPRAHQRGFVLYPLFDLAPTWVHPVYQQTILQLIDGLDEKQTAKPMDTPHAV
jgi:2-amino-4-hydroxy-6-hydroxymethyldihydropteridine diphosphokinase